MFKDHFSGNSSGYRLHRPGYPDALFDFLASCAREHQLAWDCATGSGQAARGLLRGFRRVVATDASAEQIASAAIGSGIEYKTCPADESGLADCSVDLITVAQAIHWFDLEKFYAEAGRVLKTGGVIALWCYGLHHVSEQIDPIIRRFYGEILGPFWPPERRLVEEGYRNLPFPFAVLPHPEFAMEADWNLKELTGYLETWSATARFKKQHGQNPVDLIRDELESAWRDPENRLVVHWPLSLKVGRCNQ